MAISLAQAQARDVSVDHRDVLKFMKEGLAELARAAQAQRFESPILWRVVDGDGDTLREFNVHANGRVEMLFDAGTSKLYVFPLVATVRDARGRSARIKLRAESASAVEFFN